MWGWHSGRPVALAIVVSLALVALPVGAGGASVIGGDGGDSPTVRSGLDESSAVDQTDRRPRVVTLYPNGTAGVRVDVLTFSLSNESQAETFRHWQTNETTRQRFEVLLELNYGPTDLNATVDRYLEPYGKVRTRERDGYGFVNFTVMWSNYARFADGAMVVEPGVLAMTTAQNQSAADWPVRVKWPSGYALTVDGPAPDTRTATSATWTTHDAVRDVGLRFVEETPTPTVTPSPTPSPPPTTSTQPHVTATATSAPTDPGAVGSGSTPEPTTAGDASEGSGWPSLLWVAVGGVVVAVVATGGGLWLRRSNGGSGPPDASDSGDGSSPGRGGSGGGTASGRSTPNDGDSPGFFTVSESTTLRRGGPPSAVPSGPSLSLTYDAFTEKTPIGQGGNADVYRATVQTPDGPVDVAVKEPRLSGTLHTETVERLLTEAETWDKLDDHEGVVGVVDYGDAPVPWIAMEYMDGGHLGARGGEFGFDQSAWTATRLAEAVGHAHHRGVAHLDLKPSNVLFRRVDGAWDAPKVADWGLSKHLLDHSKSVEGYSPQYAAPEQLDESYGSPDHRTDVYQLGAVCYELFTGQPPFDGDTGRVITSVLEDEPAPPSDVADVPPELDDVLLQALAKEKTDRYESVLYLRDGLRDLSD